MSASSPRRTVDLIDKRVGILFGLFVLLLTLALVRSLYLGTFRSGALTAIAANEHIHDTLVPAPRGEITDRNGDPLAISESVDQVIADPLLINKGTPVKDAKQLSLLLHLNEAKVLKLITIPGSGNEVLTTSTPSATAQKVMALDINGISDSQVEKRRYPDGTLASQMVGWLNADGKGGGGIEDEFNAALTGTNGVRRTIDDPMGQAISVSNTKAMKAGKDVALTISAPLQAEVQKVLDSAAKQYKATGATAIVTDPQTDQVLALANWPSMNDNNVTAADLKSVDGRLPAIEDMATGFDYEPGSTFKAVTVAGALQDKLVTPDTSVYVPYALHPYGKTITDAEPHGDENLTVAQILKVSSNIGADEIGQKLGTTRFSQWVKRFGFGKATGIALNGEETGFVPEPGTSEWSGLSIWNLPFGQGQQVTPIQMVQAYDAIADGGVLRTPEMLDSVGGKKVTAPKGHRIISTETASELRDMLRGVLADGGTASGAAIPGYDMAGKTGTAQVVEHGKYSNTLYNGSFIGMVPARHPKLVVAVLLSGVNNGFGGTVAAPVFQKIVGWAVPHFGINPCPGKCPASATNPAMPNTL